MFTRRLRTPKALVALGDAIVLLTVASPASPASAATVITCNYSRNSSTGYEYAGQYSGVTTIPSKTQVTAAGAEAQCLLKRIGFNPGTIDGVFGPNSQAAMKDFQLYWDGAITTDPHYPRIAIDGMPGPESWPPLRISAGGV